MGVATGIGTWASKKVLDKIMGKGTHHPFENKYGSGSKKKKKKKPNMWKGKITKDGISGVMI